MGYIIQTLKRCEWCLKSELYQDYHDNEWGVPVHDERKHFEFLFLETMQAGLSWYTILQRRESYRQAFANFNPEIIANFDNSKVDLLMQDTSIIRNRKKIEAAITNAQKFIELQQNTSFDKYIWSFTDNKVIKNERSSIREIPATTPLSDKISKDLK